MDGQFIVFFLALGVPLVFGACIGAAFRGRFGRGLGLVTLALLFVFPTSATLPMSCEVCFLVLPFPEWLCLDSHCPLALFP